MNNETMDAASDAMVLAVGKVVMNGRLVETQTHALLAGFISPERDIADLFSERSLDAQLKALKSLARTRPLSQGARELLQEWIALTDEARIGRNRVIHTAWAFSFDDELIEVEMVRGYVSEANYTSLPAVDAVIRKLFDSALLAEQLMATLADEACWHCVIPSEL